MHNFSFKCQQNFWFGCCAFESWILKFFEFLSINENDIDSFFKLINDCWLKVLVAWLEGFAVAGPGRMNINDEKLSILIVEVGVEVLEVLDDSC